MNPDDNPIRTLERQFDRMQRQFEEALNQWNTGEFGAMDAGIASMEVDLADRGDEFVLTADVPGFEKDDIDLRLVDDTIHISADREETDIEERDETFIRKERSRRSMSRTVRLPDRVDETAIEATYNNGVLSVTLPKVESTAISGQSIDID